MNLTLNGNPHAVPAGTTILTLLAELKLTPDKVAVEVNKRLVRGAQYDRILIDGDVIEIVTFVGGG